jgi:ATP-dependent RNA helicase RhlB
MLFKDMDLHPSLLRNIADRGYTETTAVQDRTLAETLEGRDVAVQSQTGTGKTAAFLITLYESMLRGHTQKWRSALIIVPTRELAVQIEGEARLLNRHTSFRIGAFYGGVGYESQQAMLRQGTDIIIGTPGRLLDLAEKGLLKLKEAGYLVIDEADRMFDMGFLPDIKKLLQKMTPPRVRQSMLFSATLNRMSQRIAMEYMNDPVFIELTPENLTVDSVAQELYRVKSHIKPNLLLGILQKEKPANALIFVNMRHTAFKLAKKLDLNGFRCQHLSGDLPQVKRLKIMEDFMDGKFPFLVATDVAARGLHIDNLAMVINYDLPQDYENYVHRIGRTARAGKAGKAISFACEKFGEHLYPIETFLRQRIPEKTATMDMFATDRSLEYEGRQDRPGRGDQGDHRSGGRGGRGGSGSRGGRNDRGGHGGRAPKGGSGSGAGPAQGQPAGSGEPRPHRQATHYGPSRKP